MHADIIQDNNLTNTK